MYQNLWNNLKQCLRGILSALNAYIQTEGWGWQQSPSVLDTTKSKLNSKQKEEDDKEQESITL